MNATHEETSFAALLQEYFCKRLIAQRRSSPETVAAYRDAFRIFLKYVHETLRKEPTKITLADLDAPLVLGFLDHLENDRGNCARTRNIRFAAIRSFLRFASVRSPVTLPSIQRVLAIPMKRFDRPALGHLSREEVNAILEAPDRSTWSGRRDHVMLTTLYNTGARVSEIRGVLTTDTFTDKRRCIQIRGKGRKERVIPLWPSTCRLLDEWIRESHFKPDSPIFPNRNGEKMSRSGVEYRLAEAVSKAAYSIPSLKRRSVSPHTFRHTTAMHLLQSGVDISVVALWLGHESPATTHMYLEADLEMKKKALQKLENPHTKRLRFKPSDKVLAFLDSL